MCGRNLVQEFITKSVPYQPYIPHTHHITTDHLTDQNYLYYCRKDIVTEEYIFSSQWMISKIQ